MDCKEINRNEMHELFLLERLSSDELAAYQNHVGTCNDCQKRQSHERSILAGIRAAGKNAMKEEIRELAREQQTAVSNRRALTFKLAAAAFICVMAPTMLYIYQTSVKPLSKMPALAEQMVEDDLDDLMVEDMPAPAPEPAKEKSTLQRQSSSGYLKSRDSKPQGKPPQRTLQKTKKREAALGLLEQTQASSPLPEAPHEALETETAGSLDRDKNISIVGDTEGKQALMFSDEVKKSGGPVSTPKDDQPKTAAPPPNERASFAKRMRRDAPESILHEESHSMADTSEPRARGANTQLMYWHYELNARVVNIIRAVSPEASTGFPDTFDVQILRPSENTWQLICSFNETMNEIDQSGVNLAWLDQQVLKLTFKEQRISYLIRTDLASTKAVLEKAQ